MENLKKESPWQTTDEHIKQVLASLAGRIREEEESRYGEIARTIAKEYDRDEREMDTDTFAALISFDIIENCTSSSPSNFSHNMPRTEKFCSQYNTMTSSRAMSRT